MFKNRPRQVLSREEYTLRQLERAFSSGEWLDNPASSAETSLPTSRDSEVAQGNGGEEAVPGDSRDKRRPSLTIIGGTKYDEDALAYFLSQNPDTEIVTGAGRGVESSLEGVTRIELSPDLFGKSARKVNVEAVLSHDPTSPLLLVGDGERVKQARAWLKRANWPREVVELP